MNPTRRLLLGASPLLVAWPRALGVARADAPAAAVPAVPARSAGDPKAPAHVEEWFSLTCTHCARFATTVFPEVKTKLIDTGKVYYVFKDFPLDRVALLAAAVSRALPAERYLPFIGALFASQDRWAFAPGVDTRAVLKQMAGLAGMSPASFDKVADDTALQKAIIAEQDRGQATFHIDATPTFVFGRTASPGELTYDEFAADVAKTAA